MDQGLTTARIASSDTTAVVATTLAIAGNRVRFRWHSRSLMLGQRSRPMSTRSIYSLRASPINRLSIRGSPRCSILITLSPKCSQDWPRFPSFPPVSRSKRPQTSLLGTDANPCTRVKHQNRPPKWLWTVPDSLARPLDGIAPSAKAACSHVAALQLRRSTS